MFPSEILYFYLSYYDNVEINFKAYTKYSLACYFSSFLNRNFPRCIFINGFYG